MTIKATLFASGDFPDTYIEIVSNDPKTKRTLILLPDGSKVEVEQEALINWTSDWYNTESGMSGHIDIFSDPKPVHPITGLPWASRVSPDELKASKVILAEANELDKEIA